MAKQIEGVAERILAAAKQEFLDKGYVEASLRTISGRSAARLSFPTPIICTSVRATN